MDRIDRMVTNKVNFILAFVCTFVIFSCTNTIPASFWKQYHKEVLKEDIVDQGPWGGYRAMYWASEFMNTFDSKHIIAFAEKHGWELIDSVFIDNTSLKMWRSHNNALIFPLSQRGFDPNVKMMSSTYDKFTRWINEPLTVYTFKTGIVMIEPGTDESIDVNGFVILTKTGKELSVYHMWGE